MRKQIQNWLIPIGKKASLIPQLVENLPAMQETLVQFMCVPLHICTHKKMKNSKIYLSSEFLVIEFPIVHFLQSAIYYAFSFIPCGIVAQSVKDLLAVQETRLRSLGWEDPLEKEMATHSSTPA